MTKKKPEVLFKVMNYDGALVIEDGKNFYNLDDDYYDRSLSAALINRLGTYEDDSEFRYLHEKELPECKKRRKEVLKILKEYFKNPELIDCWCVHYLPPNAAKAVFNERGAI